MYSVVDWSITDCVTANASTAILEVPLVRPLAVRSQKSCLRELSTLTGPAPAPITPFGINSCLSSFRFPMGNSIYFSRALVTEHIPSSY
jgi:hypothetical protein